MVGSVIKYKRPNFGKIRNAFIIGQHDFNNRGKNVFETGYLNKFKNPILKLAYDRGFKYEAAKDFPLMKIMRLNIEKYLQSNSYKHYKIKTS